MTTTNEKQICFKYYKEFVLAVLKFIGVNEIFTE